MPLINCPECASDISDKAASCPRCGYPIVQTTRSPLATAPSFTAAREGEKTIFTIHPSRRPILLILGAALFLLPFYSLESSGPFVTLLFWICAITAGIKQVKRITTVYTLTTERLKFKTGIIGRVEKTIPLAKVQNVTTRYGVMQRLLGIGDNLVESAGDLTGRVYMRNVDAPRICAAQVLEAAHAKERTNN